VTDPRVTGAVRYAQDVELEGMLEARILRSPFPHARIERVDTSAVPAGIVVLTPGDVADLGMYGAQIKDQTVLACDRARFAGDPVAAVAAATLREADEALALIDVDYEELDSVFDPVEACGQDAPLVHDRHNVSENDAAYFGIRPQQGTNVCHRFRLRQGDVEAGFAEADVVVEETFRTAGAQHAHMEPHASVAQWENGRLEVWTGTQTPFNLRSDLAGVLGIAEDRIRIVCPPMGGAFGAKTFVRLEAIVACLARKAGRPAKEVECWADTGAYADCGPGVAQKMGFAAPGPYRIPHVSVESRCVYTNLPPNGAFRGYGQMQTVWASERAMDILAERLGADPLELRLQNLLQEGDRYATGEELHDVRFAECLETAADAIGWRESRQGKGLCVLMKGMQTPSRAGIAIEASDDGTYTLRCATAEMGQGARRAISLLAAELLEVDVANVRFPDPTYIMGRALVDAVRDLKENGRRGYGEVEIPGGLDPDTGQGVASHHWHQGAGAAEVRVDEETGKVEVVRLHASVYAGRVVNRPGAELQNEGSMIMGLGTTLFEAVDIADGQVTNANLSDYEIPSFMDVPVALTHDLLERDGADVHGLGETALPPVPPSVGNALASLGLHVTDLPISAEAVLDAVDRRAGLREVPA